MTLSVFPIIALLSLSTFAHAAEVTVQAGPARVHLLELFTSEGCSSCPPAERWFSALRTSPRLWKDVVPLAFHVDYWDGLGWRDPFASKAATNRQRAYAATWERGSVYTPGFVLDGREWRERALEAIGSPKSDAGKLTAILRDNGEVEITFLPAAKGASKFQANAALLGLGLSSDVKAGENSGRKLIHDFTVLAHQTGELSAKTTLQLPADKIKRGQSAFAVWVTEAGKSEPLQAAGGAL